jgi:hypothetical protein
MSTTLSPLAGKTQRASVTNIGVGEDQTIKKLAAHDQA